MSTPINRNPPAPGIGAKTSGLAGMGTEKRARGALLGFFSPSLRARCYEKREQIENAQKLAPNKAYTGHLAQKNLESGVRI